MDTMEYISPQEPIIDGPFMLTTVDNPYDPLTDYESWFAYDSQKGYDTNGLLARLALTSNELSDEENNLAINHAVYNILNLFPGLYKIVRPKVDTGEGV